jgi:hypothetical protein
MCRFHQLCAWEHAETKKAPDIKFIVYALADLIRGKSTLIKSTCTYMYMYPLVAKEALWLMQLDGG